MEGLPSQGSVPDLKRILMVEDEVDIQNIVSLTLEAVGGFEVEVCGSGAQAVERAPVFRPDLLLMDVMMPEMDGIMTLSALRKLPQTALTPVIFLTANVQPKEIEHYKELGALGVVSKPFDPLTLAATISEIWTNHHV